MQSIYSDIDEKCIKQAYKIGYDLTETNADTMNTLAQLEADCIYSGMMSQEAKCLVWYYDTRIRITHLVVASPNSTDLAETDLINHQCTYLDLLTERDESLMDVNMER
jgi:hypothetical protein